MLERTGNRKQSNKVAFLLIYSMLLFSAGFYFMEYWTLEGGLITLGCLILSAVWLRIVFPVERLLLFSALLINGIVTELIAGLDLIQMVLLILLLAEAMLVSIVVDFDIFREGYISCMLIIAIVSMAGLLCLVFMPQLLRFAPVLVNSRGRPGYFLVFASVSSFRSSGSHRNQGIFWEPGAYQLFLFLAYVFELYRTDGKKTRWWVLILFLCSIASTVSTTGILVLVALVVLTVGRHRGKLSMARTMGCFLVLGVVALWILPQLSGFWRYTLLVKLDQLLNYKPGVQTDVSSRLDSVFYVMQALVKSPLWGLGSAGYAELAEKVGHSMFTCTPINWFAYYGLFWGSAVSVCLVRFFRRLTGEWLSACVLMGILCISTFSEEVSRNVLLLTIVFYGTQALPRENTVKIRERDEIPFSSGENYEDTLDS